jgi:hypothetical protein
MFQAEAITSLKFLCGWSHAEFRLYKSLNEAGVEEEVGKVGGGRTKLSIRKLCYSTSISL